MENNKARICVPVCVARASELPAAVARAAEVADIVEVRLDYLSETELTHAANELWSLLASRPRPIILTLRPAEYGGARPISAEDRLFFRVRNSLLVVGEKSADFWDLEHDLVQLLEQRQREGWDVVGLGNCDWNRTICSYHDFVGVPPDLDQIYAKMAASGARILKIAAQADDAIDCLPIFRLLERARSESREMIAIAMGPAGVVTRILGPSRGAYLTYGSLDDESSTAPGQLTAKELRDVYRIDRIDRQTQIMGLMGKPVSHSISPQIQNRGFEFASVNAVYIPFEVTDADAFMRRMVHPRTREIDWNLRGLSVTAPHKVAVMQHLDWIEPAAKAIGAVNTIVVEDGALHGYNTDAAAFIAPLREKVGSLAGARVAILGAGGAARSVIHALQQEKATPELFVRDIERAHPLAAEFGVELHQLGGATFKGFDVVVNATPVGTRGISESETPAVAEQLHGVRLVYDLVYNPIETKLMQTARVAGCDTLGGLDMLIAQAVEQSKLWTGDQPDQDAMRAAALSALTQ